MNNNKIFDALLKAAAEEALQQEMDALPTEAELLALYPNIDSMNKKAGAVIKREKRKLLRAEIVRSIMKSAAIFCVFAVLSTSILMAAPASRNVILNFIMEIREGYTVFEFKPSVPFIRVGDADAIFPYAPEGFEITFQCVSHVAVDYIFENHEGAIIGISYFLGQYTSLGISENANMIEMQMQGRTAMLFEALNQGELSSIMWIDGEHVFIITTSLEIEVLLALAELYMTR